MPAINWAILCDNAFPDAAGKPCLIGMFESLALGGLPATVPQMSVGMQVAMAGGRTENLPFW